MCKLLRNIASSSSDDVHLNTRLNFPTSSRFNALKEIQFVPPDCVANASRLPQSSSPFGQLMLRLREEISCRLRYSFRLPVLNGTCQTFSFMQTSFLQFTKAAGFACVSCLFSLSLRSTADFYIFYSRLSLSRCF